MTVCHTPRVTITHDIPYRDFPRKGDVMTDDVMTDESATATDLDTSTHGVTMSDAAATKAKALLDQEGRDDLALRIAVQPGGCRAALQPVLRRPRTSTATSIDEFGGVTLSSSTG